MSEVKFKVGDLVYCPSISPDVLEVLSVDDWQMKKKTPIRLPVINDDIVLFLTELGVDIHSKMPVIVHAIPENYELLSKLHPNVTFEPPPKRKKPREIIEAMLDSGWNYVPCRIRGMGKYDCETLVEYMSSNGRWDGEWEVEYTYPFDPKTCKNIIDFVDGKCVLENGEVVG